jgi:hypothetical protein
MQEIVQTHHDRGVGVQGWKTGGFGYESRMNGLTIPGTRYEK